MAFVARKNDGTDEASVRYVDGKRYLWVLSLTGPIIPIFAIALYFYTGSLFWTVFPMLYTFVLVPTIDAIMGEDTHNPPEEVVPLMSRDSYYRVLLYVAIALLFIDFFVVAWFIATQALPWWSYLLLTLGTGFASSGAILLGHELGHKSNRLDRIAAQVVNGLFH